MTEDRYERGMEIRRAVLGDAYVDNAMKNADDFTRDLQTLVTEYCWGEVWGRESLSRKQKSLNNLCMLAALNRPHELETHVRGALRNGCSVEEIRDTLLQATIYAGVPAGVDAFRTARKVFSEDGIEV